MSNATSLLASQLASLLRSMPAVAARGAVPWFSSTAIKDEFLSVASSAVYEGESETGMLLADLERRQDDVLTQLDALDRQLSGLLRGLGVTLVEEEEGGAAPTAQSVGDETLSQSEAATGPGTGFSKLPCDQPTSRNSRAARAA